MFKTFFIASAVIAFSYLQTDAQLCLGSRTFAPLHENSIEETQDNESRLFTYYNKGGKISVSGVKFVETYDCAIFVPDVYAGKKIDAISFYLFDKNVLDIVSCWVSENLPGSSSVADLFYMPLDNAGLINYDEGPNTVALDTPVTIPAGGCYVGYSFTVTDASGDAGQYPVIYCYDQEPVDGAFFIKTSTAMPAWKNLNALQKPVGNLVTMVSINGEYYANAAIAEGDFGMKFTVPEEPCKADVVVKGYGTEAVERISYVVSDTDGSNPESEVTVDFERPLDMGNTDTITVSLSGEASKANKQRRITITKVNGVDNEEKERNIVTGTVVTLSEQVPRKVVVEEVTGTGNEWAPLGITAMYNLWIDYSMEQEDETFIGISMHMWNTNDPMFTDDFVDIVNYYSGATCMVNRELRDIDTYFGTGENDYDIRYDLERVRDGVAEAKVVVRPQWTEDGKGIDIKTDVTFYYDRTDGEAPYAIAYAVTEQEMSGNTYEWEQYNILSHYELDVDDPLYSWSMMPDPCAGLTYRFVGLTCAGILSGIEGSISAPITDKSVQTHSYRIDISDTAMQTPEDVKVVAMLINTETGIIVNADEALVDDYNSVEEDMTSSSAEEDVHIVARYTIDGRKVERPVPGINILKMSDGSTVKELVR